MNEAVADTCLLEPERVVCAVTLISSGKGWSHNKQKYIDNIISTYSEIPQNFLDLEQTKKELNESVNKTVLGQLWKTIGAIATIVTILSFISVYVSNMNGKEQVKEFKTFIKDTIMIEKEEDDFRKLNSELQEIRKFMECIKKLKDPTNSTKEC